MAWKRLETPPPHTNTHTCTRTHKGHPESKECLMSVGVGRLVLGGWEGTHCRWGAFMVNSRSTKPTLLHYTESNTVLKRTHTYLKPACNKRGQITALLAPSGGLSVHYRQQQTQTEQMKTEIYLPKLLSNMAEHNKTLLSFVYSLQQHIYNKI